jgi:predicted regulator of Ras-like GTPase activity (Roadblock/LC7/MglB family)/Flp pilus assembly protein TadD
MGLLGSLLHGREIARLEELTGSAPAPSLFLRLAQLYRQIGEEEQAERVIQRGAELFPDNEDLAEANADHEQVRLDAERRRLMDRIERYPSPVLYARLAGLSLEQANYAEAERVCRAGTKSYPDYGGLWSEWGKARRAQGDCPGAVGYLEKAAALDRYNYEALMLLAECCGELGRADEAREMLERVLAFAPHDERAEAALRRLSEPGPAHGTTTVAVVEAEAVEVEAVEAVDAAPAETAPEGDGAAETRGFGRALAEDIREIRRVEGVRGSILMDAYGLVVAGDLDADREEELVAALLTNVARGIRDSADALGIGTFEDGRIETAAERIHLLQVGDLTLGVFAGPETRTALLQRAVQHFAERVAEIHL